MVKPLPPGIKYAIVWISIAATFVAGVWVGWNSRGSWGLQTELAVHISDSKVGQEIYEYLFNEELAISRKVEKIDESKLNECDLRSIGDIMRVAEEPDAE